EKTKDRRRMDPVSIMEMVIVEGDVAAKGRWIPDQGTPISVVIKNVAGLIVGGAVEPELQLVLEAALEVVQCGCVSCNFGDSKQVRDARQIFADIVGVRATATLAGATVIGFVGNRIDE